MYLHDKNLPNEVEVQLQNTGWQKLDAFQKYLYNEITISIHNQKKS